VKEVLFTRILYEVLHSERDEIRIFQYVDLLWCNEKFNAVVFVLVYFLSNYGLYILAIYVMGN